ncbi:helix-turn-helix domain-containing protein, partial [[Ruminococcus] lactaris]
NLCSTSDSAAQLHIHRNSFLYRINKIEEITGVDLREYHMFIHLAINIYIEEI